MYISQMWRKLEREVTRHTACNSEVGLEPKAVLSVAAAGCSLGRALDQAHVFQSCLCHVFCQEFPMCVHPPTQDAPFPSRRFQVKGQG